MKPADLILYPDHDQPSRLLGLDSGQCLRFLMPYLQACRANGRISAVVAEVDFTDGVVLWFASEEGHIDVHYERPRFGSRRKWAGVIPAPMRRQSASRVSDAGIEQFVRSVYEKGNAEPGGPANGSQPIGSETNRTSSAAGSRR
jgi:hypothetical protein